MELVVYQNALSLQRVLNHQVREDKMTFANLKGTTHYFMRLLRTTDNMLQLDFYESREDFAQCLLAKRMVRGKSMPSIGRAFEVLFVRKSDSRYEQALQHYALAGGEDSPSVLPYFFFNDNGTVLRNKTVEQFFCKMFALFTEENQKVIVDLLAKSKKQSQSQIPLVRFNQRTKVLQFQQEYDSEEAFVELAERVVAHKNGVCELKIPEMMNYGLFQHISYGQRCEQLEVQLTAADLQYNEQEHQFKQLLWLSAVVDNRHIGLRQFDNWNIKDIQFEFLGLLLEGKCYPKKIVTTGEYAESLQNILTPILKRLAIRFEIVEHLPGQNSYLMSEKMDWILEQIRK